MAHVPHFCSLCWWYCCLKCPQVHRTSWAQEGWTYCYTIPLLDIYLEKTLNSERYMHPSVHSSTVYSSQDMEATIMSFDRWTDKEDVVCIHSAILLSHKKEWNNAIFNNMDGPRDYHTKWSKSDKDKYHMISLMCRMERNDTGELIYKTKKDIQTWTKTMVTTGKEDQGGMN